MVTERQLIEARLIPGKKAGKHIEHFEKHYHRGKKPAKSHDEYLEYHRDYYAKNRDKRRKQLRECYYSHFIERKKYRWEHDVPSKKGYELTEDQKQKRKEYDKRYREKHKEELSEYEKKRYQKNKEKVGHKDA